MFATTYALGLAFVVHPASLLSPQQSPCVSQPTSRACVSLKFDEIATKKLDVHVAAKDVEELRVLSVLSAVAEDKWMLFAAALAGGTGLATQLVDEAKKLKLHRAIKTFVPAQRKRSSLPISKKDKDSPKLTDEPIERVLPYWQLW